MKLKGKTVFVFDIEVLPNLFTVAIKNTESGNSRVFEISNRKNQYGEIVSIFKNKNIYWCGYNCIHYDSPIISAMIMHVEDWMTLPCWEICIILKDLSDTIIETENKTDNKFSSWSKYKYANLFDQLDLLTMLFSSKLRVSLKEMQVTMQFHNVQEYDGDFSKNIKDSEIDHLEQYNVNDIDSTEVLLNKCEEDIKLRLSIEEEYGIKALNKDGVNLGMEIIKERYLAETGKKWDDIKDLRSPCDEIALNEIILPFVKFDNPILKDLLQEMKNLVVSPGRKGWEKHFLLDTIEVSVGVGGIHTKNEPEIIKPTDNQKLIDCDVASLYPSLIIEHGFYPPHLGPEFLKVYRQIKDERIEAKHAGNKLKDKTLKLSINGLSGNLQSEFSFCYSPKTVMQIRINGQLLLLMLTEKLIALGARIIQLNTDGILYLIDKDKYPLIADIYKEWEGITKLKLEEEYFEAFYQFAINDYLGVLEGYSETKNPKLLKKKGLFIDSVTLGKGMNALIIPEAINKYFADGIPVEETVRNCTDITKFLTYQKVAKIFTVRYGDEIVQRINRYYMSTNGKSITKTKRLEGGSTQTISMCSSSVTLYNTFDNKPFKDRKINYKYYLSEIYKIINPLETEQLKLF